MHESYRRCFAPVDTADAEALSGMAAELFGDETATEPSDDYEPVDFDAVHCMQGLDAVAEVEAAIAQGSPFAVAFIDVRMPPGIDGKETATRIRALDPNINLVIVTGFSDFSPIDISKAAGPVDKIFYIAKPFEIAEVVQTATALSHRWQADRELAAAMAKLEEQAVELAANESKALHMATHDSLTEAPNRLAFLKALTDKARGGGMFAAAMIDLDRFKIVNDTLGHLAGDELIRAIYAILQQSAPSGATVARLGGDEFGILFDTLGEQAAVMACDHIIAACTSSFRIIGHSVQASASIGLAIAEIDGNRDPTDVMRKADLALNDAKKSGRGMVRAYNEGMDESVRFRRRIEGGLGQAIERGELSLAYQPFVAGNDMEVVGFEALL